MQMLSRVVLCRRLTEKSSNAIWSTMAALWSSLTAWKCQSVSFNRNPRAIASQNFVQEKKSDRRKHISEKTCSPPPQPIFDPVLVGGRWHGGRTNKACTEIANHLIWWERLASVSFSRSAHTHTQRLDTLHHRGMGCNKYQHQCRKTETSMHPPVLLDYPRVASVTRGGHCECIKVLSATFCQDWCCCFYVVCVCVLHFKYWTTKPHERDHISPSPAPPRLRTSSISSPL